MKVTNKMYQDILKLSGKRKYSSSEAKQVFNKADKLYTKKLENFLKQNPLFNDVFEAEAKFSEVSRKLDDASYLPLRKDLKQKQAKWSESNAWSEKDFQNLRNRHIDKELASICVRAFK